MAGSGRQSQGNFSNPMKLFFKYCISGGTAFIIDFLIYVILIQYLDWHYLTAAAISFIFAASANFIVQKNWVFKDRNLKFLRQFLIFSLIALVGLAINQLILYLSVETIGLKNLVIKDYNISGNIISANIIDLKLGLMLAKIIAAGIVLIWNFFNNKFITFKNTDKLS